jgi:hypothetical protein
MRIPSPRSWAIGLCLLAVALTIVLGVPSIATASDGPTILCADWYLSVVNDRSRLIQVSLVLVAFGITLLWWRK